VTANTPTTPESPYLGRDMYPPTYQLVRHIISFLKWRFSKLPAGAYQWKPETESAPDQAGSEIFISADTPINPQQVGQRPAVTVLRAAATFQGAGIGDWAYTELATGAKVRMDIIPTNVMINVLSRLPVEAERLAWFCAEQIWTFREEIIQSEPSILYTGARPSISAPSPAGSLVDSTDFEWCVVVVSFPAYLQHSTTKLPLNKKIVKSIGVTATTAPAIIPAPAPAVLLQGTAVAQPPITPADRVAALRPTSGPSGAGNGSDLPQTGSDEAQSTEPLTVTIETH
jgi:hypothetical protein